MSCTVHDIINAAAGIDRVEVYGSDGIQFAEWYDWDTEPAGVRDLSVECFTVSNETLYLHVSETVAGSAEAAEYERFEI